MGAALIPAMRGGEVVAGLSRAAARSRCAADIAALPLTVRTLDGTAIYPVALSATLTAHRAVVLAAVRHRERGTSPA